MPFVRIDPVTPLSPARRRAVADAVHAAVVSSLGIPPDDRFQIIGAPAAEVFYDAGYLGIERTEGLVMIEIHLAAGRPLEKKKALFKAVHDALAGLGMRGEDVMIHLVETEAVNWSFGKGVAQYAGSMPAHLRRSSP